MLNHIRCLKSMNMKKWRNHARIHPQVEAKLTISNDTTTLQSNLWTILALSHFRCAYAQSPKGKFY